MNEKINKKFGVIEGGKNKEAVINKDDRRDGLKKDIANQKNLNKTEKAALSERIKKEIILEIKAFVLDFTGKMLRDEEAELINNRLSGLSNNDQEIKDEMCQKFPELTDLFDQLLKNIKNVSKNFPDFSDGKNLEINLKKDNIIKIKENSQFDELDFGNFDNEWKEIIKYSPKANSSMERNSFFYKKISWKNRELFLSALRSSQLAENEEILFDSIYFQLSPQRAKVDYSEDGLSLNSEENPNIEFSLVFNCLDKPVPSVETQIMKNDSDKTLPSGMTEPIYQKIFEYIEKRAKKDQKTYQHRIMKNTSISEQTPLSDEQWEKIFLPILEKAGYQKFSTNTWTKEY